MFGKNQYNIQRDKDSVALGKNSNWTHKKDEKSTYILLLIKIWNCFERTLNGEHRINDIIEARHNGLKKHVFSKHPTSWKFMECLLQQQSVQEFQLNQKHAGYIGSLKKPKYNVTNKRLINVERLIQIWVHGFLSNT